MVAQGKPLPPAHTLIACYVTCPPEAEHLLGFFTYNSIDELAIFVASFLRTNANLFSTHVRIEQFNPSGSIGMYDPKQHVKIDPDLPAVAEPADVAHLNGKAA